MGSILHFFDLNQANSSRKVVAQKRQGDGQEAPRNSLEFSKETSYNYSVVQEDIPYSCQVKKQSSKMSYRSNDTPIKRLIDEEMSKRMNNKHSSPSVVARLMGMDAFPSETKPAVLAYQQKDEKPGLHVPRKDASKLRSASIRKIEQDSLPYSIKKKWVQSTKPREHPQEELLQKFKKDFQAWQTSKVWEHSKTIEEDSYLPQEKANQIIAQASLNKEKMSRYKKLVEPKGYASVDHPNIFPNYMNKDGYSSATKIVILRPSVEMSDDAEGSLSCSPELLEKEANMQDFLEEVKERLKSEIIGKARIDTGPRGFTNETSFSERSQNTKQFARHIAKQIRESVTRDLGSSLIRSESTRSYRCEPDFINRNTRKLLSERLKNVLRNETYVKSQSMHDFSEFGNESCQWGAKKPPTKSIAIRSEQKDAVFDAETKSPRKLVRSFSAPVSFGKLLLQDQHAQGRTRIHSKHEASENSSSESRKRKKEGFNLKGTVSNLRQNFTLRGKFFGKKTHSIDESDANEFGSSNFLVTVPSVVLRVGSVQENSTEVPPSPASVSSSSFDEFFRPGVPSPVSPLQAPFIEDQSTVKVSTDGSSILPDPKNLLQHVECSGLEEVTVQESRSSEAVVVQGHAQAYIRDILITAGLYESEVFKEPIPNWVFDEVEEAYVQQEKTDEIGSSLSEGITNISHKLLFDLMNEALPRVMMPKSNAMFLKLLPCPKNLLDDLWRQIQIYEKRDLNESNSADEMAANDVRTDTWCTILDEDIHVTGKKVELAILNDLVDEFLSEIIDLRS
ncbi:uncharacterized protein A4U43_C04F13870 [Asparagus officinalis]|uniref:DUF4378 domain-containing protein n=1 Tax=Asparagus officinalis TaxID=4686 RepID=A0A5P1F617_ASPOF|nr:uncharacterized protein LOC109837257 [Asparagus officinalis]ONK71930.1 uncharacterized protein A4U43_C04F13870 [Asparagus officinalis]